MVVAGTNGAGKTTLIQLEPSIVVGDRIDPDHIALSLSIGASRGGNSGEPQDLRVIYDRDDRVEWLADDTPSWFAELGSLAHPA